MKSKPEKYDFSGWATKNDLACSDGRTIRRDAFKHSDGQTVPLVWNHLRTEPFNVLGHAVLENRKDGVYAYCSFNNTETGQAAKELVIHGDITALSIFANKLKQIGGDVIHGAIREVSLVYSGANPGASIEAVFAHSDDSEDEEFILHTGEEFELYHESDQEPSKEPKKDEEEGEETIGDIFETMNEKQKNVVYALVGQAISDDVDTPQEKSESAQHSDDSTTKEDELEMKHNVFDQDPQNQENQKNTLTHDEVRAIFDDAKRHGTLRDSMLAHGIENIDWLFPEARNLNNPPEFITRDMGWVKKVMTGVHKTPFSRIKSMFADLTEDEARAKGYITGNFKKEQVFTLLKRSTSPTTIYKKQKLERDDVVDITDFDAVAWVKSEMRSMLDEEIARAILIGDGRLSSSDDKIKEDCIRPIWTDEDLFTVKFDVGTMVPSGSDITTPDVRAKAFIRSCLKARKQYKGSGNPKLFTTEDMVTDCLLLEDGVGRVIYDTIEKLTTAMRVSEIVTVEVMENATRTSAMGADMTLMGIIVNLSDYSVGADKGGAVAMFDDFDIDYNAMKYLIETRCSGALIKPFSAIALELTEQ